MRFLEKRFLGKRFFACLLCAALAAGSCLVTSPMTGAPQVVQAKTSPAKKVFKQTNDARSQYGLPKFKKNAALTRTANVRAKELAFAFSHSRPDGRDCFSAFNENGVSYMTAAENIAYGSTTASGAMQQWLNSPGHAANILNPNHKKMGVGHCVVNGTHYWVQCFTD